MYCLPSGYISNQNVPHFDDTKFNNDMWQKEVYETAVKDAKELGLKHIIDIGCGSGYKLVKNFPKEEFKTMGLELEPTLTWLKTNRPDRDWLMSTQSFFPLLWGELVICADVIEHIEEPAFFLECLSGIQGVKRFYISTPDRHVVRGPNNMGPPGNPHHYREWTANEFGLFIGQYFNILKLELINPAQGTLLATCESLTPSS